MRHGAQGAHLVVLHGWAMDNRCWDDCLHCLGQACHHQRIELPGHGGTEGRQSLAWRKGFIDHLYKTTPAGSVWVGWSLGGMLAQQLACCYPSHVRQLICIAANVKFLCSDDWHDGMAVDDFRAFTALFDRHRDQAMRRFLQLLDAAELSPSAQLCLQAMLQASANTAAKRNHELRWGLDCLADHDVRTTLPAYPGPVTFVGGEYDRLVSPASLYASSLIATHGQTLIIPHAGHALPLSHPRPLAKQILACINECCSRE